jgi:hypothetical protein
MKTNYGLMMMNQVIDGGGGGAPAPVAPVLGMPAPAAPLGLVAPAPAAPVAPAPAAPAAPIVFPDNWKDALPDDIKNDPSLKAIHNVQDLAKSYKHSQGLIGRDRVVVPDSKTATEADWKAFYQKVGLPQKLEEYNVEVPKNARFADGFLSEFKKTAYEAGVLPHQMNKMLSWYHEANEKALSDFLTQDQAQQAQKLGGLKQEWGNDWQRNSQLSNGMLAMAIKESGLGAEDVKTWLEGGAGNDPMLIKLLFGMSKFVKEDVIAGDGSQLPASVESIQQEINSTMGDKNHAFHDKNHPGHIGAVQQMEKLFQKLHPPKAQMQNVI